MAVQTASKQREDRRHGLRRLAVAIAASFLVPMATAADAGMAGERQAMVAEVVAMARDFGTGMGRATIDARVIGALTRVPRHEFVPPAFRANAYENRPLPIGHGQTISQPYIVALMTDLLRVGAGDTALEIGTGSGYQAAVAARAEAIVPWAWGINGCASVVATLLATLLSVHWGYATVAVLAACLYALAASQFPSEAGP